MKKYEVVIQLTTGEILNLTGVTNQMYDTSTQQYTFLSSNLDGLEKQLVIGKDYIMYISSTELPDEPV